ncbi:hypothetical protein [Acinetobacter terrae]|uniref:Uncharacterized protein n=1 Tax=Acinetobacter terrae TaxID=2731247 RepID=A0A4R0ERB0_9GAMM|nr:hypothetical protein [Acinetobacter terrae]TCB62203.1 hypothetical protein E0H85_01390 [Acinetobacter terrae]
MPFLLLIWNNKRWTLIIVLLLCLFFQTWQVNSLGGDLRNAEIACDGRVEEAIKPYKDAEKKSQEKANEVSEEYETTREAERVRTETITHNVQKIVERPIYINHCFDTDGVSAVNQAAGISYTSEP